MIKSFMKKCLLLSVLIYYSSNILAQGGFLSASPGKADKPIIDSSAVINWARLGIDHVISDNGKYFVYNIEHSAQKTLIVRSVTGSWEMQFPDADKSFFSRDSKQFIFMIKDTLCFLSLTTGNLRKKGGVVFYKQPENAAGEWIAYLLKDGEQKLVLYSLLNGEEHEFNAISDCIFSKNGRVLVLKSTTREGDYNKTALQWVTLPGCRSTEIWSEVSKGQKDVHVITGYDIDDDKMQLAFNIREQDMADAQGQDDLGHTADLPVSYTIWYYNQSIGKAICKVSNQSEGIGPGLFINGLVPKFSKDGGYILFQLLLPEVRKPVPDAVKVDIWSYHDTVLQCTQLQKTGPKIYAAAINVKEDNVIRLTQDYDDIKTYSNTNGQVVISHNTKGDRFWLNQMDTNCLVSLEIGTRKPLPGGYKQFIFSPHDKYLVYYDLIDQNYYSYNLSTGVEINLSGVIPYGWLAYKNEFNDGRSGKRPPLPVGIAGWSEDDLAFFVYDNYDIWRLDLSGSKPALNLTNGYGRLHHIKFRVTNGVDDFYSPVVFKKDESVLLTAFNTENKYNGFFRKSIDRNGDPELLSLGPWVFYQGGQYLLPISDQSFNIGMKPLKARNANVWIVKRQTAVESPNYFVTTDFRTYRELTDCQPQKAYNWLTAELISWMQLDNTLSQGILYKPENFDHRRKYPLIINYYQQRSHRMYQFPSPEFMGGNIDIPWFVSRGYLVFTPDIYIKNNDFGSSTFNSVVSAANWLSQLPFVDEKRMGINGHSIGGGETNYLITHTDKFAAAIEGAGVSDAISAALQLGNIVFDISRLEGAEYTRGDVSIWENPGMYLESSPIMKADKIKTPLLIMHNKIDGGVPWAQGVELFIALRRMEKPVWMLQYDNGGHVLWGKEAEDFSIRATQFFDYYLKGAKAPKWMVEGIPARLKGIETGY